MGKEQSIITPLHKKTVRDYIGRMCNDKIRCMQIARKYGKEFWDGDRRYGYGGYQYDGRYAPVAKQLCDLYNLKNTSARVLDVGCGKGFLLYEMMEQLSDSTVYGLDISEYAIQNAHPAVRNNLIVHKAQDPYPYKDKVFDFVFSITTLHNLKLYELKIALEEIERVGKQKYIVVESYRNEAELFNLQCWALTCESFFTPAEWVWIFNEYGYTGDYEFIYFE